MFKELTEQTFDAQVQSLCELVSIPSVSRGTPEPGMPFGKAVDDALTYTLALANRLGFPNTRSLDGYCGTIDYGEGDEMLMVMAHLDVVPAGPAWSSDPFTPEIRNGRVYGRGVIDDKGPAVSTLYALQAVKESGIPLKRRVRILLGCDEEKGWGCIDRYKQTEEDPTLAFTPDGVYPLVYSEMGICHTVYEKKLEHSGVHIDCGYAPNVVPGEAGATLPFAAQPVSLQNPAVTLTTDGNTLRATGRGGHAAEPHLAQNALLALLEALAAQPLTGADLDTAASLHALLKSDLHGEGFGLNVSDSSGQLTLSPDILTWDETGVRITLDCRYPFSLSLEQLLDRLDKGFAPLGFTRVSFKNTDGHFIDPKSELVTTLLDVYNQCTGLDAKPLTVGGGTYARAFKNAVAFGAEPENAPAQCHMPDESIGLDEIRFNTRVIAEAIARLAGA